MGAMLCILAFAAGHCIRDGWPSLGTTHGARALGAFICALGALDPLVGLAVFAGFYTDQKHGEGQSARGWGDVKYLLLSGITSSIPLMFLAFTTEVHFALLPLVGLLKPGIWFAAWYVRPDRWHPWLEPTRVSAIAFGGALGAAVAVL
jgi:hypothetical protein